MNIEPRLHVNGPSASTGGSADHLLNHSAESAPFPEKFEEDDELRSEFIRQLAHRARRSGQACSAPGSTRELIAAQGGPIPRNLVRFWHDPKSIPSDVQACLDSWAPLRDEGVTIRMFNDDTAATYISDRYGESHAAAFNRCEHPAMRSDYLRLCFVLAEGGLYVDADDVLLDDGWRRVFRDSSLKLQPLCYDIPDGAMVPTTELGLFDCPTSHRIFYVNNNPIAARPGDPVLRRALARSTRLLLSGTRVGDIQYTTGPGNLTAALAAYAREEMKGGRSPAIELLFDWDATAEPDWTLGYRHDARNWRNWSLASGDRQDSNS